MTHRQHTQPTNACFVLLGGGWGSWSQHPELQAQELRLTRGQSKENLNVVSLRDICQVWKTTVLAEMEQETQL